MEPCIVNMRKEEIRRVIENLLSNAIKYSNLDGRITVLLQSNTLQICDTGIGIERSRQDDIFRRYQRFNKERGGFGIGLSIVWAICENTISRSRWIRRKAKEAVLPWMSHLCW